MPMIGHLFPWNITTPTTNLGTWQTVQGAQHLGLLEFGRVVFDANLIGATNGTLDIVIQTNYFGGAAGHWKDIARFNQIGIGAPAISWTVALTRVGSGTAVAPVAANVDDVTPTIAVNTVLPQNLGDSLRLLVKPGAGTTVGAALSFAFVGSA